MGTAQQTGTQNNGSCDKLSFECYWTGLVQGLEYTALYISVAALLKNKMSEIVVKPNSQVGKDDLLQRANLVGFAIFVTHVFI